MNAKRFSNMRAIVFVLLGALLIITSFSCNREAFVPPPVPSNHPDETPMKVDTMEFWRDYKADPVAAAAKYEGKTLHFQSVRVDQMSFLGEGGDYEWYVQEGTDPDKELVKFRADDVNMIINVRDDYIVEIIGRAVGIKFGYISVQIQWLNVIDPPGGDPNPPDEY